MVCFLDHESKTESVSVLLSVGGSAFPPSSGGAATILYHLLHGIDRASLDVLTAEPFKPNSNTLRFPVTKIPKVRIEQIPGLWRIQTLERTLRYVQQGLKATASKTYDSMLLVFPDTAALIGGFLVARLRKIPFHVYLIDLLSDSRLNKTEWLLLRLFEKRILKQAQVVYSLSDGITAFYRQRVDREYVLLPHCIPALNGSVPALSERDRDRKVIVFAGQIHEISRDALQNLIRAVRLIDAFEVGVQIFTNRSERFLQDNQLTDHFVETEFITDQDALAERLRQADILFSPVAFHTRYPHQAATCFPTKTFDYARARRPILVHAPADTFYVRYMEAYQSALCVTRFEPAALKEAIVRLLTEEPLQQHLVENAVAMIRRHHAQPVIQRRLVEHLFGVEQSGV